MKFEVEHVDGWRIAEGLAEKASLPAETIVCIDNVRGEHAGEDIWLFAQVKYGITQNFYIVYSDSFGQCEVEEFRSFDMAIAHFMRYMPLFQS